MNSSVNLADNSVRPWQYPLLDGVLSPAPVRRVEPPNEPPPPAPEAVAAMVEARLAEAYAEGLERGIQEGREKGYAAGAAAAREVEERLLAQSRRLAGILDRFDVPIAVLQRPVEEAVAALALEVARCVIGSEVSRSHTYLVRLIREAIARVPIEMGRPKVLLNPADLELVRELVPEIGDARAALVAEEGVEPGGCLVIADGDDTPVVDRRWHPRAGEGVSQVDLTLAARWRSVILTLFSGSED